MNFDYYPLPLSFFLFPAQSHFKYSGSRWRSHPIKTIAGDPVTNHVAERVPYVPPPPHSGILFLTVQYTVPSSQRGHLPYLSHIWSKISRMRWFRNCYWIYFILRMDRFPDSGIWFLEVRRWWSLSEAACRCRRTGVMSVHAGFGLLLWICVHAPGRAHQAGGEAGGEAHQVPSASTTLVWGPGLQPHIVLPARFFYIQAVDSSGRKWV